MKDEQATTYLQIDLQNLFFEAKNKGKKLDFDSIWHFFNGRDTEILTGASVYLVQGEDFDSTKFEKKLKTIGYDTRVKNIIKYEKWDKNLQVNRVILQNSNHNVSISIDCLDKINTYNKWILMSGDGDFADLCKYLKQKGKKIEIWSFRESYSSTLEMYADKIHFIDNRFYYKKPKVKIFGINWRLK